MKPKYDVNWVLNQKNPEFLFFWGHTPRNDGKINKSCFSQWYDHEFEKDGYEFMTNEHYMMLHKALLFNDHNVAQAIMEYAVSSSEAKQLGREVKNFDNKVWDEHKYRIVYEGNIQKFKDPDLQDYLLSTDNKILVEASPYDKIWGIGLGSDNKDSLDPKKWQGGNLLGFALMEVRDYYR